MSPHSNQSLHILCSTHPILQCRINLSMNGYAGLSPPLWTYVVAPYGRLLCAMLVIWQRVCVLQARRQSPLSWDPFRLARRQMALPVTVTLGRGRWDQQPGEKWSGQTCVITQDEQHWLTPGSDSDLCMNLGYIYYMFELGWCLYYNQSLASKNPVDLDT